MNVIQLNNPEEVISEETQDYEAGVTEAEQTLERISLMMEDKSSDFAAGFWDVIFEVVFYE